jgi:hypothetical protein
LIRNHIHIKGDFIYGSKAESAAGFQYFIKEDKI